MRRLAAALGALPSRASLDRVLACCADHVNASVIDTLRDHASVLYPLLVAADRQVGVVATKIYDAMGARATHNRHAFDRFWRDARTHTLHDPLVYKVLEVGDYALNGRYPPPDGYS